MRLLEKSLTGCGIAMSFLLLASPVFAQTNPQKPTSKPTAAKVQPLDEKENPEMIGKRNINKHQINFYSIDKEVGIGRQFAQEVDRSAKLVEDPIIVEYINKVGQNLVLHSDAKVPFTIKVIDADEVNAFALPGGFFYVNKGLILAADNEAELAGPMAHEIAHVAAEYGLPVIEDATEATRIIDGIARAARGIVGGKQTPTRIKDAGERE